ncbi:hypothetical protein A3Q56_02020 [Intoshia linei]|uniref:Uncharacterized protein n=1 Tax=Intoshia linei TaxID=1819745 RepID=A0A177B7L2_9BILA|nr:hypothetical protein A3Q56_02020 [Intoshia linei]
MPALKESTEFNTKYCQTPIKLNPFKNYIDVNIIEIKNQIRQNIVDSKFEDSILNSKCCNSIQELSTCKEYKNKNGYLNSDSYQLQNNENVKHSTPLHFNPKIKTCPPNIKTLNENGHTKKFTSNGIQNSKSNIFSNIRKSFKNMRSILGIKNGKNSESDTMNGSMTSSASRDTHLKCYDPSYDSNSLMYKNGHTDECVNINISKNISSINGNEPISNITNEMFQSTPNIESIHKICPQFKNRTRLANGIGRYIPYSDIHSRFDKPINSFHSMQSNKIEASSDSKLYVTTTKDVKNIHYWINLHLQTVNNLQSYCTDLLNISTLNLNSICINNYKDDARVAVGHCKLLINNKLKKFSELCLSFMNMKDDEKYKPRLTDIESYWQLAKIEITKIEKKFLDLMDIENYNEE